MGQIGDLGEQQELVAAEDTPRMQGEETAYAVEVVQYLSPQTFVEALDMARDLGDVEAEYGYLGNLALIYGWQEKHQQALDALLPVLEHVRDTGNVALQLRTLQALVEATRSRLMKSSAATRAPSCAAALPVTPMPTTLSMLAAVTS